MRLIDADNFKEYIMKGFRDNESLLKTKEYRDFARQIAESFCRDIDEQPTAFDVNEVLRQLNEEKELSYADFDRYVKEVSSYLDAEYDDFFHMGIERAIRIITVGDEQLEK